MFETTYTRAKAAQRLAEKLITVAKEDTVTGEVRVIKILAVHDCGRVIYRLTAEGQIIGGVVQGLSFALLEGRIMDKQTGAHGQRRHGELHIRWFAGNPRN